MATKIFLSGKNLQIDTGSQQEKEIRWYVSEVLSSHIGSLRETLQTCVANLDEENQVEYKLPLSSHKTETIKGILTRQNFKITALHLCITNKNFNNGKKYEIKLKSDSYLIIRQLLDCHDAMENAIGNIDKILENDQNGGNIDLFVRYFEQVCSHISLARKSLSDPNPAYVFPKFRIPSHHFEPPIPNTGALDFSVNDGELTVEFKSLTQIEKRPWSVIIDKQRNLSFADIVRNKISTQREIQMNKIIANEYTKYLKWKETQTKEINEKNLENESSITSTFKNIFLSNSDPSFSTLIKNATSFLEQSVTFLDEDNQPYVVQINDKCEVVTPDPVLLSISVKLESLEKNFNRIRENISNIYP